MRLAIFLIATAASAAVTNVSVSVTPTQALISYTAPTTAACSIEVSESPTYSPVVHDVDTSIFGGTANQDSRPRNLVSGRARIFVVGLRRAERPAGGFMYSRALQNTTMHYYRITCGSDTATGSFRTAILPLGNTYSETYPPDPALSTLPYISLAGHYAWPEFTSWTDRSETVIDPRTGSLIKRISLPGDALSGDSPSGDNAVAVARGTNWTSPSNVIADDSASATYSGAGQDFLFIGVNIPNGRGLTQADYAPDSITVNLKAWCSGGGCGTGNNAKVRACLTLNSVNCWPTNLTAKFQEVTLGTSALPSTYSVLGTTTPVMDAWYPVGFQGLNPTDMAQRSGTADVAVDGTLTRTAGTPPFHMAWIAGSHITVNGQDCIVQTPISREQIKIDTGSCSLSLPLTATAWSGSNFGWLIQHETTSTDTINIQYAKATIVRSHSVGWPNSGSVKICADNPVTNSVTGASGFLCYIADAGIHMLYWINAATGAVNYLGLLTTQSAAGPDGWETGYNVTVPIVTTPTADPSYFATVQDRSGKWIALSCTLHSTYQAGDLSLNCNSLTTGSAGHDLISLAAAFTASDATPFDPVVFNGVGMLGLQDRKFFLNSRYQQDAPGWHLIFDPDIVCSTPGCVGGGQPGAIVAAQNTWSNAPARWCGLHTSFVTWSGSKVWVAGPSVGAGNYISNLTSSSLTATPGVAAGSGSCPAGSSGCDNITVDGEPKQSGVTLQAAAVGDVLRIDPGTQEFLRIVTKTDSTHWLVERGYGFTTPQDHPGSTAMLERCLSPSGYYNLDGSFTSGWDYGTSTWDWVWDFVADPHGTGSGVTIAETMDHVAPQPTLTTGGQSSPNCLAKLSNECYAVKDGVAITARTNKFVAMDGEFGGTIGVKSNIHAEDHAAPGPIGSSWLMDGRPVTPNVERQFAGTATLVSGQLFKMTPLVVTDGDNITQLGGSQVDMKINRKIMPTIAYCGSQALTDISSAATGNQIPTDNSNPFTYCMARKAGECRIGSSVGDVYVNCPVATKMASGTFAGTYGCDPPPAGDNLAPNYNEPAGAICVANSGGYIGSVNQVGFQVNDFTAANGRTLTQGFARYQATDDYWTAMSRTDWVLFRSIWANNVMPTGMLLKLPAYPPSDTVARNAYIALPINLRTPASVDNVIIRFGYAENGPTTSFFCTSRQEACIANSASIGAVPFNYAGDGVGGVESGITGVACSSGCSIAIPAISSRVLYYQVVYRNASNAVLSVSPVTPITTP